jgi:hypothetical protein
VEAEVHSYVPVEDALVELHLHTPAELLVVALVKDRYGEPERGGVNGSR